MGKSVPLLRNIGRAFSGPVDYPDIHERERLADLGMADPGYAEVQRSSFEGTLIPLPVGP